MINKLKHSMSNHLSGLVFVLIIIQPLLDVASYFASEFLGSNSITTLLRFGFLGVVALIGFILSDKKRIYFIVYGVMVVYWAAHVLNRYKDGYISIVEDTANYLRIISLIIYSLSFITFVNHNKNIKKSIYAGFAVNVGISILFTALPWLFFEPLYTYQALEIGVMGWFLIPNAQAVILCVLTPFAIYFAYNTKKYFVYIIAIALSVGILFFTGTKLTFFSIYLICAGFIFLFVINLKLKSIKPVIPLLLAVVLVYAFRGYAPMNQREGTYDYSQNIYNQKIEDSLKANEGENPITPDDSTEEEEKETTYLDIMYRREVLTDIYADEDIYGKVLTNINNRFGVYNVMNQYNYSTSPGDLSDFRKLRVSYASLLWKEKDVFTKLLGFEYTEMIHNGAIFDLENDLHAIFYCTGFVGFGLYLLYFAYVIFIVLRRAFKGIKTFLSVEMGVVGMNFILAMGAAIISGYVLRRPNATIYLALITACLYDLCVLGLPKGDTSGNARKKNKESK